MPEVRFVRRVSMRNSVHLMTASAKEVIAAAILEGLADITYAEDDGGLGVDGWIYLPKLSTAILAALDAAGYVVTKVHERSVGMQVIHYGGMVYVVHPDVPLHVWDGNTMTRVTADEQEKQG